MNRRIRLTDDDIIRESTERLFNCFEGDDSWYRGYCKYNVSRILADAKFVSTLLRPGDRLLDVGAVPPLMVSMLTVLGHQQLCIADPLPNSFQGFCDPWDVRHHQVDLLNSKPGVLDSTFDFVCLNEVIEHLSGNLVTAVETVVSCVRPGGRLLVTTPNLRSLSGILALVWNGSGLASKPHESVRAQYERASAQWGYFGHLREFTSKETIEFIESFGFRFIEKSMQENYLERGKLYKCVSRLERLSPPLRLFGKYLFEKNPG